MSPSQRPEHPQRSSFTWECCQCGNEQESRHEGGYNEYCRNSDTTLSCGTFHDPHRRCRKCVIKIPKWGHYGETLYVCFADGRDYDAPHDPKKNHGRYYEGLDRDTQGGLC